MLMPALTCGSSMILPGLLASHVHAGRSSLDLTRKGHRFKPCRAHHTRVEQGFRRPTRPGYGRIGGEAGCSGRRTLPCLTKGDLFRGS